MTISKLGQNLKHQTRGFLERCSTHEHCKSCRMGLLLILKPTVSSAWPTSHELPNKSSIYHIHPSFRKKISSFTLCFFYYYYYYNCPYTDRRETPCVLMSNDVFYLFFGFRKTDPVFTQGTWTFSGYCGSHFLGWEIIRTDPERLQKVLFSGLRLRVFRVFGLRV